jgi:hypothetical protein
MEKSRKVVQKSPEKSSNIFQGPKKICPPPKKKKRFLAVLKGPRGPVDRGHSVNTILSMVYTSGGTNQTII